MKGAGRRERWKQFGFNINGSNITCLENRSVMCEKPEVNRSQVGRTSSHLPVFHLGQRPPLQRLCLVGLGDTPWQSSSGTLRPAALTQSTLRDLKPRPQAVEHCQRRHKEMGAKC